MDNESNLLQLLLMRKLTACNSVAAPFLAASDGPIGSLNARNDRGVVPAASSHRDGQ